MPKMKTRRCAAKRLKVTGSGRVVSRSPKLNHLLSKKSRRMKRRLKLGTEVTAPGYVKAVESLLPYS
ncbi:MAG: 50S ribosomal protein L35 [Armatimonadia bacterium]